MNSTGKSTFCWLALALLCCPASYGRAAAADFSDTKSSGYSGVPIVGYDDKSGWLYGAAGFVYSDYDPGINAALFLVSNLNDFHSFTFNYEQRKGNWLLGFHGLSERAFDYYYGEGDLTSPSNPFRISMYHFEAKPTILYKLFPHFRIGIYDDYRSRVETGIERVSTAVASDPQRLFPDESTNTLGLRAEWDTRDKIISPNSGNYYQLLVTQGPGAWTTWNDHTGFTQLELDLRHFQRIYHHVVSATRFLGAAGEGEPTYLFRYRLGGLDTLRGDKDNRFRGDDFFVFQEELRWFIRKYVSVNVSADLGDIGDSKFHQLKLTGQAGLRVGLPPDWGQKLRVDLGYGFDQQTFQIQFGEVF